MTPLRWPGVVIIVVYLTGVLVLGFRFARRQTSTEEYFVARRAVPGWAMGMSLFATIITSITFIAFPGNGYSGNWAELVPGIMALVALGIAGAVVIPFFRRKVRMSAFEYFEQRFGRGIRSYAALTFAAAHFSKMGFVIYLVALVVHSLTAWPIGAIIAGVGLATVAYTSAGGISAVIWADVCQVCILLTGLGLTLGFLLFLPPGGPAATLHYAWNAHKFSLGVFSWDPAVKSIGVMVIYGLSWYLQRYTADQTIIQRYLVARSDRDAVRGVALGACLCVPVWALFLLVGSLTWSYYHLTGEKLPAFITKPDQAYPYFLSTHIPPVLAGVILAALFSAAMSGLSSDLNALAVVGVKDFYGRMRPEAADRQLLLAGKGFVGLAGVLCTLAALALARTQGAALPLWYLASSVLAGGLLGVFGLAYFTRRANSTGTAIGIAACLIFTLYAALTSGNDRLVDLGARNFAWNSLLIGAIGHVIVVAVGYPASLIFRGGPQQLLHLLHVLVPPATEIGDDDLVRRQLAGALQRLRQGVRALQRGDDALETGADLEGLQDLLVRGIGEADAAPVPVKGVLRTDRGVIETGRHRMRALDLAVAVLEDERLAALQDAEPAAGEAGRVRAPADAVAPRLDSRQRHARLLEELEEEADRVAAAADAGDELVGQPALPGQDLRLGLPADDLLKIAHHHGIGMRAIGGAEDVVGRPDIRHPVAHGFVDRVLERLLAGLDAAHLGAHEAHAEDVQRLALHVHRAHVDHALEAELRADRRRGHAVLAGAGLGDDALLAHPAREQGLADRVVDLVGAGVEEILALQVDLRPAAVLREPGGEVELGRPPGEFLQVVAELGLERRVVPGREVGRGQLLEGAHEGLRHIDPAVDAEMPAGVREGRAVEGCLGGGCHGREKDGFPPHSRQGLRNCLLSPGRAVSPVIPPDLFIGKTRLQP